MFALSRSHSFTLWVCASVRFNVYYFANRTFYKLPVSKREKKCWNFTWYTAVFLFQSSASSFSMCCKCWHCRHCQFVFVVYVLRSTGAFAICYNVTRCNTMQSNSLLYCGCWLSLILSGGFLKKKSQMHLACGLAFILFPVENLTIFATHVIYNRLHLNDVRLLNVSLSFIRLLFAMHWQFCICIFFLVHSLLMCPEWMRVSMCVCLLVQGLNDGQSFLIVDFFLEISRVHLPSNLIGDCDIVSRLSMLSIPIRIYFTPIYTI